MPPTTEEREVRPATRREGDEEKPLGPKAARTRAQILNAAQSAFIELGYQRTTVGEVAARAGISLGAVYQYFRDRGDLMGALVTTSVGQMQHRDDPTWRVEEGHAGLWRVLHGFVVHYMSIAPMAALWEEVTHVDPDMAALRRRYGHAFTGAVEAELRRAAACGLLDHDLDAALTAVALTGMVDRYCYVTYIFDPPTVLPTAEASADVLTALWAKAVGLTSTPSEASAR